jgi:hypothetical protein
LREKGGLRDLPVRPAIGSHVRNLFAHGVGVTTELSPDGGLGLRPRSNPELTERPDPSIVDNRS